MTGIVEIQRRILREDWDIYGDLLSSLKTSIQDTSREIEEQAQLIEDDIHKDIFYDSMENWQATGLVQMNSFFSICFALFEFQLVQICSIEQRLIGDAKALDFSRGICDGSCEKVPE